MINGYNDDDDDDNTQICICQSSMKSIEWKEIEELQSIIKFISTYSPILGPPRQSQGIKMESEF